MRYGALTVVALLALAACNQTVPDSGAGVGFNDYAGYEVERAQREAAAAGQSGAIVSGPVSGGPIVAPTSPVTTADPNRTEGVQATPGNAAPVAASNTGISDEQDFDAVSDRESIESDAARRAEQAAQFEQIAVTAVPTREGGGGPNIVAYAINAPNAKGQEWYSRLRMSGQRRFQRNCAKYRSPDDAQRAFLTRGGPERDPTGIDPDGDGFACGWDPAPFRLAASSAAQAPLNATTALNN